MLTILLVINFFLIMQLIWVLYNSRGFLEQPGKRAVPAKQISILIPARDEAAVIGRLLDSLIPQQDYIKEVLVLNDHSTDGTAAIIQQYQQKLPMLKVYYGKELPDGWTGKNYACQQLGEYAAGEWLLFLDADVTLEKNGLSLLQPYLNGRYKMMSAFPRQRVHTFLERMLVPFMMFLVLCHLPIRQVSRSQDPRFTAAHGGFICIHKKSYQKAGGHAAIRSAIVDDMELMRLMKRCAFPVALLRGEQFANMRMYESNQSVWLGFRKNIFTGTGSNIFLSMFVCLFYALLYVVPTVSLVLALITGKAYIIIAAAAAYIIGAIIKFYIDYHSRTNWHTFFLYPIACSCFILLALDAIRIHKRKEGYVWKGRRYYR
ncbi:glycosyltransferase family 2 protein [Terribacillus saccharophilus]|uniref:glycosyltransferase n=1 Tax=Terribacillus saccharophilus TaxID=361277 RepID=UPI0039824DA6